mgnify:CR=1 FL=1
MIQKEKLVQFYFSQYRDSAMALKKKNNDGKKTYEQRIGRLITEMQRTKTGKLTQPHLEEYHRQIRNMAYYALKQKNQYAIMQIRDILMPELVRLDIGTLREEEQELAAGIFKNRASGRNLPASDAQHSEKFCGKRNPFPDH